MKIGLWTSRGHAEVASVAADAHTDLMLNHSLLTRIISCCDSSIHTAHRLGCTLPSVPSLPSMPLVCLPHSRQQHIRKLIDKGTPVVTLSPIPR
jgi:hypothetical protein